MVGCFKSVLLLHRKRIVTMPLTSLEAEEFGYARAGYPPDRVMAGEYWGCGARFGIAPLEGAVILAKCLDGAIDIGAALRAYEQRRIPRTSQLVRQSRRIGQVGQWQHPLAYMVRDALTRHILARIQDRQLDQVIGYVVWTCRRWHQSPSRYNPIV
jgi:hypothetical protein